MALRCSTARPLESDLGPLRRQLIFRASHLGMRELDLIVGAWAKRHLPNYGSDQLQAFNQQILQHETPELLKKILGQLPIDPQESLIEEIRSFALDDSESKIDNT